MGKALWDFEKLSFGAALAVVTGGEAGIAERGIVSLGKRAYRLIRGESKAAKGA